MRLVCLLVCVVIVCLWWSWSADPSPVAIAPPRTPLGPASGSERSQDLAQVPGLVRIQVQSAQKNQQSVVAGGRKTVVEVQNLGPLAPEALRSFCASFEKQAEACRRRLESNPARTDDSAALLQEAELLLDMERFLASADALRNGRYLTSRIEDVAPALTMPGIEVAQISTWSEGKAVLLTVLMPWREYANLERARDYHSALLSFDDSERARRFNELPDGERLELCRQILAIQRNPAATDAERQFVRDTIGFTGQLMEAAGIVITR